MFPHSISIYFDHWLMGTHLHSCIKYCLGISDPFSLLYLWSPKSQSIALNGGKELCSGLHQKVSFSTSSKGRYLVVVILIFIWHGFYLFLNKVLSFFKLLTLLAYTSSSQWLCCKESPWKLNKQKNHWCYYPAPLKLSNKTSILWVLLFLYILSNFN